MPHTSDHRYFWALLTASVLALALAAAPAMAASDDQYDDQTEYDDQDQYNGQGDYDDEDMNSEDANDSDQAAGDGNYDQTAMDEETVEVTAPHIRIERGSMLQPTGKISMSRAVDFSDLDLRTAAGAVELKERVRTAAGEICDQLGEFDPPSSYDYTSCYSEAVANAMPRANSAIADARNYAYRD